MKPHIWRQGDKFRVLRPLWVDRVGYPLIWHNLMDEVQNDPRVAAAWDVLCGLEPREAGSAPFLSAMAGSSKSPTEHVPRYFLIAAAKALVEARGFGGNERKILHFPEEGQSRAGSLHTVLSKRVVKTGKRVPPSGGTSYTQDGPEDWYEPGGLEDMQTHILLKAYAGEIEATNVELVSAAPKQPQPQP